MNFIKTSATVLIAVALLGSCAKDKTKFTPPAPELTPEQHITESEKLTIPAAVDVEANMPTGNTRVATYFARGVQKYKAQYMPGTYPFKYEWVFVAPQADLFDENNRIVGTHGAGPYWALSPNDSLFAQQFTPVRKASSPDGNSIDWLLLKVKDGKTPTGIFANVTYIQRIATVGGKAPAPGSATADATIDIPYTAVYRFIKKNQ
jgi:Protein of unknown function (DUF3455)